MSLPTLPNAARFMNDAEWEIVSRVFTSKELPWRYQILVTNGLGPWKANMSVPSSLLGTVLGSGSLAGVGTIAGFSLAGPKGAAAIAFLGALSGAVQGYVSSLGPQGYILLVGPQRYLGMEKSKNKQGVLVHETAHVWQGQNSWFAMSYIVSSFLAQAGGMISQVGSATPGQARLANYHYKAGGAWSSYNAEQKAQIVQDWFRNGESTSNNDPLWPYIRDYVRKGIA